MGYIPSAAIGLKPSILSISMIGLIADDQSIEIAES
jgi:hypothetical protein